MSAHTDVCTILYRTPEDTDILTRRLFDVNMLLFDTCPDYRSVVLCCCEHIRDLAMTEREGYKKPHGFSGANAGIPFNIIALADGTVMLNPRIVMAEGSAVSYSNCGSLLLDEPIQITRYANIRVEYFDIDGWRVTTEGYFPTVQHEIDHNNGILITDRRVDL